MSLKLHGLTAATHSPFGADGELHLDAIEPLAQHLARAGVTAAFICGTTGESHSLTKEERQALALRWRGAINGTSLRLVVHVGSNCLADSRSLAAHAESVGANGIAAFAPSYFKPGTVESLVDWCAEIASAAPSLPFYFYDIPSMTGVNLSMPRFLEIASERIPTLAGLKFTNPDLVSFQQCLRVDGGRFDIPWGMDECLLAAFALGGKGAVGSTYNFAAPLYLRLIDALNFGDLEAARKEQFRSVELVQTLNGFGFMGAAKAVMEMLGLPVGPPRLPLNGLTEAQKQELGARLEKIGFFNWSG